MQDMTPDSNNAKSTGANLAGNMSRAFSVVKVTRMYHHSALTVFKFLHTQQH